jgi:hypothetical protein
VSETYGKPAGKRMCTIDDACVRLEGLSRSTAVGLERTMFDATGYELHLQEEQLEAAYRRIGAGHGAREGRLVTRSLLQGASRGVPSSPVDEVAEGMADRGRRPYRLRLSGRHP